MRRYFKNRFVFVISLLFLGAPSHAKTVQLRWNKVPNAISYELEIHPANPSEKAKKINLEKTEWKGDLVPGGYTYFLRSINKFKRPGPKSDANPLIVTPLAPEITAPEKNEQLKLIQKSARMHFAWKSAEGATHYKIEIKKGERLIFTEITQKNSSAPTFREEGNYTVSLRSMIETPLVIPAPFGGKKWESKTESVHSFSVEKQTLAKAEILFPIGRISKPADSKLNLVWDKVQNADEYEIELETKDANRSLASASEQSLAKPLKMVVRGTSIEVPVKKNNSSYRLSVRAKRADEYGQKSISEFRLEDGVPFQAGGGRLRLAPHLFFYSSQVSSTGASVAASTNAVAAGVNGSFDYWFRTQTGIDLNATVRSYSLATTSLSLLDLDLMPKFRFRIFDAKEGPLFQLKAGPGIRQSFGVLPSLPNGYVLSTLGAAFEFELSQSFGESTHLSGKLNYFSPLSLSGSSGSPLAGGLIANQKLQTKLEIYHAFAPKINIGASFGYEQFKLNYGSASLPDSNSLSGASIGLVAVFRLGSEKAIEDYSDRYTEVTHKTEGRTLASVDLVSKSYQPTAPEIPFDESVGTAKLSPSLFSYNLYLKSPSNGFQGSASAVGLSNEIAAQYWLKPKLGFEANLLSRSFSTTTDSVSPTDINLFVKIKQRLVQTRDAWVVLPKAGVGLHNDFMQQSPTGKPITLSTLGLSLGLEASKPITKNVSFNFDSRYFFPLTLSGTQNQNSLYGSFGNSHIDLSSSLSYQLNGRLSVGTSLGYSRRSIQFGSELSPDQMTYSSYGVGAFLEYRLDFAKSREPASVK